MYFSDEMFLFLFLIKQMDWHFLNELHFQPLEQIEKFNLSVKHLWPVL